MKSAKSMIAHILVLVCTGRALAASTKLVDEGALTIQEIADGVLLLDFGRVAFGNLRVEAAEGMEARLRVHFGEDLERGHVNRRPPGTVRYYQVDAMLEGADSVVVAAPADRRNTQRGNNRTPPAVLTPEEWGVLVPFRWVEIEGWKGEVLPEMFIRQSAYLSTWDDNAASFESSDEMLNQIWELCRYSIKATTFAGVYVDGDRERIPYEADSYLNQLSHYATDTDIQMARDTFAYMMTYPTWPTEWAPHMVFMAHADWMHTGDVEWIRSTYEGLKSKMLLERRGEDGLVLSSEKDISRNDIVDWPILERDGFVHTRVNTVVNAFHIRALEWMAELADAIGNQDDAATYQNWAEISRTKVQELLFDTQMGLYRDGIETEHYSLHANLFPLAFDLVPEERRQKLVDGLVERGMRCSVYAAQYLLEGLFENGAAEAAVALMLAEGDRSWRHMVESGTTITWEAWDQKYKPNQDWNHAWGAAPANLLPRFVLGVQPLTAGWGKARICPHVSGLRFAKGKVPTPRGGILVDWRMTDVYRLTLTLPDEMDARVELPRLDENSQVFVNDQLVEAQAIGERLVVDYEGKGRAVFEVRGGW